MKISDQSQFMLRLAFVTTLLLYFYSRNYLKTSKVEGLDQGECMRDLTFDWTEQLNLYFRENVSLREWVMIFDSATYDVGMIYFLYYFGFTKYRVTMRMLFSNALLAGSKITFQEFICTLGRLEGYLWFFPGFFSLNVPYFDVNDFYYSGHLGMNDSFLYEFICASRNHPNSWHPFLAACFIVFIFSKSLMMVVLRTHYFIDLIAGLYIGLPILHLSEKLSFISDVKIMGLRKHERKR